MLSKEYFQIFINYCANVFINYYVIIISKYIIFFSSACISLYSLFLKLTVSCNVLFHSFPVLALHFLTAWGRYAQQLYLLRLKKPSSFSPSSMTDIIFCAFLSSPFLHYFYLWKRFFNICIKCVQQYLLEYFLSIHCRKTLLLSWYDKKEISWCNIAKSVIFHGCFQWLIVALKSAVSSAFTPDWIPYFTQKFYLCSLMHNSAFLMFLLY